MSLSQHFTWPEVAIFLATLAILTGYHVHLAWKVKHSPLETAVGMRGSTSPCPSRSGSSAPCGCCSAPSASS